MLESRLDKHVRKFVRLNLSNHTRESQSVDDSAIGQHLLENERGSSYITTHLISILHMGRSKHHL